MGDTIVIIDTNMFFVPFSFNVDIFAELHRILSDLPILVVMQGTIEELRSLEHRADTAQDRRRAKMALQLIEMKRKALKIESVSAEYVDDQIVRFASDWEGTVFVATQDLGLRHRLKQLDKGVGIIVLRQKKYLEVER